MRPHESLHRPDMKDVGFEEPTERVEVFFDLKRDVTPNDFALMRAAMLRDFETGSGMNKYQESAEMAAALQRLNPAFDAQTEIPTGVFDNLREQLRLVRDMNFNFGDSKRWRWYRFATITNVLRQIDPSFNIQTVLTIKNRQTLRQFFSKYRGTQKLLLFADFARALRDIDPTFNVQEEITDSDRRELRDELAHHRGLPDSTTSWREFAWLADNLSIIDPTFDPNQDISAADREGMRTELQSLERSGFWSSFAHLADHMNELSKRMQIIEPAPTSPPFPQEKKY